MAVSTHDEPEGSACWPRLIATGSVTLTYSTEVSAPPISPLSYLPTYLYQNV